MIKAFALVALSLSATITICAQTAAQNLPAELKGGIRVQKAQKLYWENGFTLDYANLKLAKRKLHLGASYVSTRLGSAIGSNAIEQDLFF